jgi:hypothetical protein
VVTQTKHREEVIEALIALENDYGQLTPEVVVEAAADPASPLHKSFEWNDETAAAAYRIEQARALIRSVDVEITVRRMTISAPRYVRDPSLPLREPGFRSLEAVSEAGLQESVIDAEVARCRDMIARGRRVAKSLGREADFLAAVREALK